MNMYYFGPANEYIEAGYATSNLSTCRTCKLKIQKEAVRLAYVVQAQNFHSRHWYHLNCFQLKPLFVDMDPETQIYNLDQVEYDNDEVLTYIQNQIKRLKADPSLQKPQIAPRPPPEKEAQKDAQQQNSQNDDSRIIFEENNNNQFLDDYDEEHVERRSGRKLLKADRLPYLDPLPFEQPISEQQPQPQQTLTYSQLVKKYTRLSFDKLKAELGLNTQPKNGVKRELAQRCADGALLGRIPQCPICRGGKPRYDHQSKTYKCLGYKYDSIMYSCETIFQQHQIQRQPWRGL